MSPNWVFDIRWVASGICIPAVSLFLSFSFFLFFSVFFRDASDLKATSVQVHFHRKYKQLFSFYSGVVNFLMQLQFLALVELFFKQLKGYSF